MKKKIFLLIAFLVLGATTLSGCTLSFFPKNNPTNTYTKPIQISANSTPTEIVESYIDAVVTIFVTNRRTNEENSFGSGVAVASGGYIATNYHVISLVTQTENYKLQVYHNNSDVSHNAEVLWHNRALDCAIIKCECINLPYVNMEDRFINTQNPIKALEQVIAIGTPIDFSLQNTATLGYISSAEGRVSYTESNIYENLIQHTAPINHGNSGGPLFDLNGKLIGLNTSGNDDANSLFFAVPIYPIIAVIDRVVSADSQSKLFNTAYFGLSSLDRYESVYSTVYFEGSGVYIVSVSENGPSHNKLKVGDVIKSIKLGDVTYNVDIRNDLLYPLLKANAGDVASLHIVRGLLSYNIDITLG